MAFYKFDNNELFVAPSFVHGPSYDLNKDHKDKYTFPVEGWYWFDTLEEAKSFFNIPEPTTEEEPLDV
jgi:hypothetical protein